MSKSRARTASLTGKLWLWPAHSLETSTDTDPEIGLPRWQALMLEARGVVGADAVERYLSPALAGMDDPSTITDMPAALAVLQEAIAARWPIVVYGDYDVDGVCSTALLVEFLREVGANVEYYIPERCSEGYGLNHAAVREIAERAKLLITTDCGITAVEEIRLARALGCEVVVVDHHRPDAVLPEASACLNPQREDCGFGERVLCAAGVAFMLVIALRRALRQRGAFAASPEPDVRAWLDLVALATIADMVPLRGLNRILVAAGLKRLEATKRPGLRALIELAGIKGPSLTTADVAFRLAPRINARGRVSHAKEAVELVLSTDHARAQKLAIALDDANQHRRELERDTVTLALARASELGLDAHAAIVVYDPAWHPGVLGLVAMRLVNAYHRPAVVVGEGGKGSGRSIPGLDLHAAIGQAGGSLIRFGGHAAAAGITIDPARLDDFCLALNAAVSASLGPPPYPATLAPDLEVREETLTCELTRAIDRMTPFGKGNPEPLWVTPNLEVKNARIVGEDHLKLTLGRGRIEAIGFRLKHLLPKLTSRVDLVHHVTRDTYGGREKLVLQIEDIRAADSEPR